MSDRQTGKDILTLMLHMPKERMQATWGSMTPEERESMYGGGHAEEIDKLVKQLGTKSTRHLEGDAFGNHLADLHDGEGMADEHAASVLHTPSGVRLAQRAVTLKPGSNEHQTTMAILNARYSTAKKQTPHPSFE